MIAFVCSAFQDSSPNELIAQANHLAKKLRHRFGTTHTTVRFTPDSVPDAVLAHKIMVRLKVCSGAYADPHLKSDIFEPTNNEIDKIVRWLRAKYSIVCVVTPDFGTLTLPFVCSRLVPKYKGRNEIFPMEVLLVNHNNGSVKLLKTKRRSQT